MVDIVNSLRVGVDTDVSLVNLGPMMADLIWIGGLPLRRSRTVLRVWDDFRRYLLGGPRPGATVVSTMTTREKAHRKWTWGTKLGLHRDPSEGVKHTQGGDMDEVMENACEAVALYLA